MLPTTWCEVGGVGEGGSNGGGVGEKGNNGDGSVVLMMRVMAMDDDDTIT